MNKILLFQPPETHVCSYLPGQRSRSLYVDPRAQLDDESLTLLSLNGFRRSGRLLYRPACPACNACRAVRLRVKDMQLPRNQRRIMKKNQDLTLEVIQPDSGEEFYRLYERYINERHADGDMYPPDRAQYEDFLVNDYGSTRFLTARLRGHLLACMVFDILGDGLSAVYCFYNPDEQARSPGTFMILTLSRIAAALGLPYNYLGYYVHGSRKMEYKRQFFPLEEYSDNRWQLLSP